MWFTHSPCCSLTHSLTYSHTHTHTHTRTRTRTRTHTHTHARTHTHTHTHTQFALSIYALVYRPHNRSTVQHPATHSLCPRTHTDRYSEVSIHSLTLTHPLTHLLTHSPTRLLAWRQRLVHAVIHSRVHSPPHPRIQSHTQLPTGPLPHPTYPPANPHAVILLHVCPPIGHRATQVLTDPPNHPVTRRPTQSPAHPPTR